MPSTSIAQGRLARMALHAPGKIKGKNRGILKMKGVALREFAETPEKGLPYKAKKGKKR